jgi:hypothetical protein
MPRAVRKDRSLMPKALVQHDVADFKGIERVGFAIEMRDAVLNRRIHNRVVVRVKGDVFAVPFE